MAQLAEQRSPKPQVAGSSPAARATNYRPYEYRDMNKITLYINEVFKEMQKVSWPTRKELYSFTVLTIIASAIISLLIFGADRLIGEILGLIYGSAGS